MMVLHSGVKIFLWPRWVYLFHLFCSVLLLSFFAIISILLLQLYPYETLKCKENDSRLYKAICSIYMVASICIIVAHRTSLPPFVIPGCITGQAYG